MEITDKNRGAIFTVLMDKLLAMALEADQLAQHPMIAEVADRRALAEHIGEQLGALYQLVGEDY